MSATIHPTAMLGDGVIGVVLGHAPQHLAHRQSRGGVRIGHRNVFREYATVHRAIAPEGATVIGDDNPRAP